MMEPSVVHADIHVERFYPVPPARVFRALTDPVEKARWFGAPPDHELAEPLSMDFGIGGRERLVVRSPGGVSYTYEATFYDIVAGRRLVYAYQMFADARRISVSLGTMELHAEGGGTRLRYTEQGAFLDGLDGPEDRARGVEEILDTLGCVLADAGESW